MSIIDVESLLSEITADAPCGEDLEYDPQFVEMEKQAQETPERQYGNTIIPSEPPDWRGVHKTALGLFKRTRDLRVAAYLSRALLNTDGMPGFADGLALLEGLIERYWDGVYPQLDPDDDNDPTLRINIITVLCDPEATLRALREMPLASSRALGRFSLRDVQIAAGLQAPTTAKEKAEPPTQVKIDGAFQDTDPEELKAAAGAVIAAMTRVERIEALLTDQVGASQAPDMSALGRVLKEIHQVLTEQMQRLGIRLVEPTQEVIEETAEAPATDASGAGTAAAQRLVVGEITRRDDALRMLDKICEYFQRYEPSSPVPFLLRRAKHLANKDFIEILNDLTPGGASQVDLIFGSPPQNTEN